MRRLTPLPVKAADFIANQRLVDSSERKDIKTGPQS